MIQRAQTLFLLLAVLAFSLMFIFPIATYQVGQMLQVSLHIADRATGSDIPPSMFIPVWPLLLAAILLIGITVATVFLYRKRRVQLRLVMAGVLINMIFIISVFMMADRLTVELNNSTSNYEIGAFLPVASLVFLMLAYRGIRRDERLVRSADRLRG